MEKKALLAVALLLAAFSVSVYDWNTEGQLGDSIDYGGLEYWLVGETADDLWSLTYTGSEHDGHRIYVGSGPAAGTSLIYVEDGGRYLAYEAERMANVEFYSSGCIDSTRGQGYATAYVENGSIIIEYGMEYYCCAVLEAEASVEPGEVSIYIINVGEVCRCLCNYDVGATIHDLPEGDYHVRLCGVLLHEYGPQYSDYGILWEGDVSVP